MRASLRLRDVSGWVLTAPDRRSADALHTAIGAWFGSPFWLHSSMLSPVLSRGTACADLASAPASLLLEEGWLAKQLAADGAEPDGTHHMPLVDRHLLGAYGPLGLEHYAVLTEALQGRLPARVRIGVENGEEVDSSLAAFVAWLLSESTLSGFGPHIADGITGRLSRWNRDDRSTAGDQASRISPAACLPTLPGLAERTRLLGAQAGGVAAPLYPTIATLLPEVSPRLFPTVDSLAMAAGVQSGVLIPLTRTERFREWVRRRSYHHVHLIAADSADLAVRQARRAKRVLRRTPLRRLLIRARLDSHGSRGLLRRLLVAYEANPLVTRATARELEAALHVLPGQGSRSVSP